ncbi:hypothetical protein [Microscilla marina]|uniref:Uncharacterized protein n=1 Tax=Microscilla marina ATCC 23134 TaxID=313606 RepID=A1ZNK0_MICM2|nr:hypothetical protein [Microscilla marina]EAY28111.1 hypothetical protein M23134_02221 [Microscilla marina ATCC 23134]
MQHIYLWLYLRWVFCLSAFFWGNPLTAQPSDSTRHYAANKVNESVISMSDRSYITATEGLGNLDTPLLLETSIAPTYFIRFGKSAKLGISISPKVVIRIARKESFPVLTPSYTPRAVLYWRFRSPLAYLTQKSGLKKIITPQHVTFLTLRFNHHSNGQAGSFFIPGTTDINFDTGNFTTNCMELALNTANFDPKVKANFVAYAKAGFERHFNFNREADMKFVYYWQSVNAELRCTVHKFINVAFLFKHMTGIGTFKPQQSYDTWLSFRLGNYSDFSFFARYYHGPDYYNLRYVNHISQVSFGLLVEPLNLPLFRR